MKLSDDIAERTFEKWQFRIAGAFFGLFLIGSVLGAFGVDLSLSLVAIGLIGTGTTLGGIGYLMNLETADNPGRRTSRWAYILLGLGILSIGIMAAVSL